jgi:hypothetical protein
VRFCTIDAGGDHFWLRIRAWCQGGESKGLFFGYINSDAECEEIRARYNVEPKHTFLDVGFDQERMAGIIVKYGWQGMKGDGNRKNGWDWPIKGEDTKKEIESWATEKWQGKISGTNKLNIFSYLGGHNCLHTLQIVSEKRALSEGVNKYNAVTCSQTPKKKKKKK